MSAPIWDPDVVGYCKVDDRAYLLARMTDDPEPQRSIEKLRAMDALGEQEMLAPASVGRFFGMDDEPREVGGTFDGFTVTSDADPGL